MDESQQGPGDNAEKANEQPGQAVLARPVKWVYPVFPVAKARRPCTCPVSGVDANRWPGETTPNPPISRDVVYGKSW